MNDNDKKSAKIVTKLIYIFLHTRTPKPCVVTNSCTICNPRVDMRGAEWWNFLTGLGGKHTATAGSNFGFWTFGEHFWNVILTAWRKMNISKHLLNIQMFMEHMEKHWELRIILRNMLRNMLLRNTSRNMLLKACYQETHSKTCYQETC